MAEKQETNGKNKCGCLKNKSHLGAKDCDEPACKECKVCCEPDCPGCEKKCTEDGKCKCRLVRCGCEENCYGEEGEDKPCQGGSSCVRCKTRCGRLGNRCICANCDCGCSYGLCNCCPWCKRNYCTGNCNGYVIGRCKNGKCEGHYPFEGVNDPEMAPRKPDKDCRAVAQECKNGLCLYKCTACGRLCVKHFCHCIGSVLIIIAAIVVTIFIAWNKYPEKFRRVYYDLCGALNTAPGHPGRSLSNLVGDRIPEETNVDRYPAFHPKAYVGLA